MNGPYHSVRSKLAQLLASPFKFHVGAVKDLPMDLISTIPSLSLPNLHSLTCDFSCSATQVAESGQLQLSQAFILPKSLTKLGIQVSFVCTSYDFCQAFLNLLPTGLNITTIEFACSVFFTTFDLSSLRALPKLTSLDIHSMQHGVVDSTALPLYDSLPLTKFRLNGGYNQQLDWSIFEPQSPLMQHIQELEVIQWRPTQLDWEHLSRNRPPQLHTLTLHLDEPKRYSLRGLSSLRLTSLRLMIPSTGIAREHPDFSRGLSALTRSSSLTHLSLSRLFFAADGEQLRLLLGSLQKLTHLHLIGHRPLLQYPLLVIPFELLPEVAILDYVLTDQFQSLVRSAVLNEQLVSLTIGQLDLRKEYSNDQSKERWITLCQHQCQTMKRSFHLVINDINSHILNFNFHHTNQTVSSISSTRLVDSDGQLPVNDAHTPESPRVDDERKDVPAPRLVGVETNPGPFVQECTAITSILSTSHPAPTATASNLFVDGVLSIFRWLSLSDVLPAYHSCRYWYECGLKERCRSMELCLDDSDEDRPQFRKLLGLIESPLRYHITNITEMNMYHLLAIKQLNRFINLHTCEFSFSGILACYTTQLREWNSECTMITPDEFRESNFQLPSSLRRVKIHLCSSHDACSVTAGGCHSLINHLHQSCITHFEFQTDDSDRHFDFSHIRQISQLTSLRLRQCTPLTQPDQRILASSELHELSLNVPSAPDWAILHPDSPLILSIRSWSWYDSSDIYMWNQPTAKGKDSRNHLLYLSHHPPPNIVHLEQYVTTGQSVIDFTLFTHLSTVTLSVDDESDYDQTVEPYIPILSRCSSITHLIMNNAILTPNPDELLCSILMPLKNTLQNLEVLGSQTKSFSHAFGHLPPITQFTGLYMDPFESFLTMLSQSQRALKLTTDTLHIWDSDEFPFDESKFQYQCHLRLSHPRMQPGFTLVLKEVWRQTHNQLLNKPIKFRFVYINSLTSTPLHLRTQDQTMSVQSTKDVPPARLVGIETNPGPFVTTTTKTSTTPTTQTIFVDGLLSIFSLLKLSDLLPALRSCHYWYSCGLKERCREISYEFKTGRTTRALPELLRSPFKFHISRLVTAWIYQLSDLPELLFPNLKQLVCSFHGPSAPPAPAYSPGSNFSSIHSSSISTSITTIFTLPTSLTSLRINILPFYVSIDSCQTFLNAFASSHTYANYISNVVLAVDNDFLGMRRS